MMGRRAKSELLDLTERIIQLYTQDHKTLVEIEAILRGEGIDISREAIRRSVKGSKEVAREFQESIAEAKILLDTVRENPNTDVIEATTALLSRRLFEYMKSVEEISFEDTGELATAINRIAQSQTQIAKLRLTYQKGFESAKKVILSSLKDELTAHPDLLERLSSIVTGLEAMDP
jgi:replicative DNA helicase